MIIEILGAKMLAPYFGTSHFVWTAQIGVTLLALATGYYAGGRLADASPRVGWVYGGIALASAWLCLVVLVAEPAAYFCLQFRLAAGSLLGALLLFFVPLSLLAMVGPFFARVITTGIDSVGRTVGRLTALSTLGSVIGTLLIGYVLIPHVPNSVTMYGCAIGLLVIALLYFALWHRRTVGLVVAFGALMAFLGFLGAMRTPFATQTGWRELYRGNSNFGMLQVIESENGNARFYLNDLLTQNSYDPHGGQSLSLFTYLLHGLGRGYAPEAKEVLCIGMGVGIVPMVFARENAQVDVVEINPAAVPLATKYFDFDASRLRLTIGDGRQFLAATTNRYDVIVLDAFLGESPPSHLMTRESFAAVQRCLKPGGVLVMNAFGEFTSGRDFLMASLSKTLGAVFRSQRIHAAGNGNVFFVASDAPDLVLRKAPDLTTVPGMIRGRVEAAYAGVRQTDPAHGRVLTDNFNPAEFYDAANRMELRRTLALSYRPE